MRRPLAALWGSLCPSVGSMVVPLARGEKLIVLEKEQYRCMVVSGRWGFLSGLLYEGTHPLDPRFRRSWLRKLIEPFIGHHLAHQTEMCGTKTLMWNRHGTAGPPAPVQVQLMELPAHVTEFQVSGAVKDVRQSTTLRLFATLSDAYWDACDKDTMGAPGKASDPVDIWSLLPRSSPGPGYRPTTDAAATPASVPARARVTAIASPPAGGSHCTLVSPASSGCSSASASAKDTDGRPDSRSEPMFFAELWGGDQAEDGALLDMAQFETMLQRRAIEPSASAVLYRLGDERLWSPAADGDVESLQTFDPRTQPSREQASKIVAMAWWVLGDELISELARAKLVIWCPADRGMTKASLPEGCDINSIRAAFVRGSFVSAFVVATHVLASPLPSPPASSASSAAAASTANPVSGSRVNPQWIIRTDARPGRTPGKQGDLSNHVTMWCPSPFQVAEMVEVLKSCDWDAYAEQEDDHGRPKWSLASHTGRDLKTPPTGACEEAASCSSVETPESQLRRRWRGFDSADAVDAH